MNIKTINSIPIVGSGNINIPKGEDAVNPFKGWYNNSSELPRPSVEGDFAYVSYTTDDDPPQEGAHIWMWSASQNQWYNTNREVDTSDVHTFETGENVNEVSIVNDTVTGGEHDVLSAEQGKVLDGKIETVDSELNGRIDEIVESLSTYESMNFFDSEHTVHDNLVIGSSGPSVNDKWGNTSTQAVGYSYISGRLQAGDTVKLTAKPRSDHETYVSYSMYYALLSSDERQTAVLGEFADFIDVEGYKNLVRVPASSEGVPTVTINIPTDCYLYVTGKVPNTGNDITPSSCDKLVYGGISFEVPERVIYPKLMYETIDESSGIFAPVSFYKKQELSTPRYIKVPSDYKITFSVNYTCNGFISFYDKNYIHLGSDNISLNNETDLEYTISNKTCEYIKISLFNNKPINVDAIDNDIPLVKLSLSGKFNDKWDIFNVLPVEQTINEDIPIKPDKNIYLGFIDHLTNKWSYDDGSYDKDPINSFFSPLLKTGDIIRIKPKTNKTCYYAFLKSNSNGKEGDVPDFINTSGYNNIKIQQYNGTGDSQYNITVPEDCYLYVTVKEANDPTVIPPRYCNMVVKGNYRPQKIAVMVNVTNPNCCDGQNYTSQDNEVLYDDYGIVALPDTYRNDGEATRLIIYCHGGAVSYNTSSVRFDKTDVEPHYWLSEGYAIMDVDGNPFGTESHFNIPQAMDCYVSGYKWVIEHYNIKRDGVFLGGRSMGGGTTINLLRGQCPIPVIAACANAPHGMCIGGSIPDGTNADKQEFYCTHCGFYIPENFDWSNTTNPYWKEGTSTDTEGSKRKLLYDNWDKLLKNVPIFSLCTDLPIKCTDEYEVNDNPNINNESKNLINNFFVGSQEHPSDRVKIWSKFHAMARCPVKFFGSFEDLSCPPKDTSLLYHKMLTNSAQITEVRSYPETNWAETHADYEGHHYDVENGYFREDTTNIYNDIVKNVPSVYIEMLEFWRRYEQDTSYSARYPTA